MSEASALEVDVLVVGGGMAGAIAALAARDAGATVVLARRAPGATALSSGGISVAKDLSALPGEPLSWRRGPLESARRLTALRPEHPYAVVGPAIERLGEALGFAARELADVLVPPLDRQRVVMTPFGTAVPCALVQPTMEAGDLLAAPARIAVVGLSGHLGFDASLVADGIERLVPLGAPAATVVEIDPFGPALASARPHELARALEPPGAAEAAGELLRAALPAGCGVALFPPVLGLDLRARVADRIAARAGLPVAETLADVPSVPGARLHAAIEARLAAAGVAVLEGRVEGARGPGEPARVGGREVRARSWVLATGRFVGGGIQRWGALEEATLGLPVEAAEGCESGADLARRPATSLTVRERRAAQPLLSAGVRVDSSLRPLDDRGKPVHARLFAAGAVIGGHEQAADGTGLGVAILTGHLAGRTAAAGRAG